jgi:hypothetical protein
MMLILLLTELTHLGVELTVEQAHLKVRAPAGALTADLRQAMQEQKAALMQFTAYPYVGTIDGLGTLTGNRQECDVSLTAPERQERLRYRVGVRRHCDGIEQFYYPGMVTLARIAALGTPESLCEASS